METQLKLAMMNDELGQARTSKKEFLDKIESIIPWDTFVGIIEPCYYKGETIPAGTDAENLSAVKSL